MKPRIEFSYEDAAWIKPVSQEALADIEKYFGDNPEYAEKLNNTEIKLTPMITNVWLDLPEENEVDFKKKLNKLPAQYSKDEFWKIAGSFKKYHTKPPAKYLLNLFAYPWDVDRKGELLYSGYELTRC